MGSVLVSVLAGSLASAQDLSRRPLSVDAQVDERASGAPESKLNLVEPNRSRDGGFDVSTGRVAGRGAPSAGKAPSVPASVHPAASHPIPAGDRGRAHEVVVLELSQPEHVADGRFRFLADLRGEKPGPYDREVTFNVQCNSEQEEFSGFASDAIVHEMSARGTCVATATMEHDGGLVVSERRQFVVPSASSEASWSRWLLLLPVLGGLVGAGYASKRRRAERDSPESPDIEVNVPHVAHRVLSSRPSVGVTSGSAPRLVLRVSQGSPPPCVEYRSS